MNDAERADFLARAIDELLHGAGHDEPTQNLDDQELSSLLGVAKLRAKAGEEDRDIGAGYEATVWQRIEERISRHSDAAVPVTPDHAETVVEAIAERRPLHEDVSPDRYAEEPEVWERVRKRIEGSDKSTGATAVADPPSFASGDPELDSLVRAALSQTGQRAIQRDSQVQHRLWARMRRDTKRTALHEFYDVSPEPRIFNRTNWRVGGLVVALLIVTFVGLVSLTIAS